MTTLAQRRGRKWSYIGKSSIFCGNKISINLKQVIISYERESPENTPTMQLNYDSNLNDTLQSLKHLYNTREGNEGDKEKNSQDICKTNSKVADINPAISVSAKRIN